MKYGKKVVDIVDMYREVRDTYGTHQMDKYLITEDKKFWGQDTESESVHQNVRNKYVGAVYRAPT